MNGRVSLLTALFAAVLAAACTPPAARAPVAQGESSLAPLAFERGRALYEQGRYDAAAMWLREALAVGVEPSFAVRAHKLLAFIACIGGALEPCKEHFRSALAIDAGFELERAEAGHPMWGPVFAEVRAAATR